MEKLLFNVGDVVGCPKQKNVNGLFPSLKIPEWEAEGR